MNSMLAGMQDTQPASRARLQTRTCLLFDLGFAKDYGEVWNLQKRLVELRRERTIPDALIVVEHDHVITLGRSSHPENVLARDLPMFEVERGGDVTYHGPGQLVAYPIVSLEERALGIRGYVELLEAAITDVLRDFSITDTEGKTGKYTGVWVAGSRKVASIGVAVSHWVTYHGLALNVNTDLSYFARINPCGFDSSVMTSIAREAGRPLVDFAKAKSILLQSLAAKLQWNYVASERDPSEPEGIAPWSATAPPTSV